MKLNLKPILAIALISAVLATGVFLYINSRMYYKGGFSAEKIESSAADIRIEKARYVETRDGREEWEVEADSALYFKADNITVFENVKVIFYSKNGISYTLVGKKGRLKNDTKDMDVAGDVVVTSADGYELRTDSLRYTAGMKQISTKDRVVFTGPNMKIEGVGFLADMLTERVSVLADVRTVLKDAAI